MSLRNCERCSKLYIQYRMSDEVCDDCFVLQEKEFQLCKAYLKSHSTATSIEVSEHTGISLKRVIKFVKSGRIHSLVEE